MDELVNMYQNWELSKLNLGVLNEENNTVTRLTREEIEEVKEQLKKERECAEIRGIVEDVQKCEEPKVMDKREKILQDYREKVLRKEVFKERSVRGMYGEAYIPLKERAIPTDKDRLYNMEKNMKHTKK